MKKKPRELSEICHELQPGFETVIVNEVYCRLSFYKGNRITCKYLGKEPDHNQLYRCESLHKIAMYMK